jgi:hypothetical protein
MIEVKNTKAASFEDWVNQSLAYKIEIKNMLENRRRYLASISSISNSSVSTGYKSKCLIWAGERFLKGKVRRKFIMPEFDPVGFKKWRRTELLRMIKISESCRRLHSELLSADDKSQQIQRIIKRQASDSTNQKTNSRHEYSTTRLNMWLQN